MPDTQNSIENEGLPVVTLSVSESPSANVSFGVSPSNTVQAPVDSTLTQAGKAADARATGDEIRSIKPATDGTAGQLLRTNGNGTTQWVDQGLPTDAQTAQSVSAWLDNHPEATTTVQDGAITKAKLNAELQGKVDEIDELKSDTESILCVGAETEIAYKNDGDGFINQTTGEIGATSSYQHTDYIDLYNYVSITYRRIGVTNGQSATAVGGMAFYDENKGYVSGVQAKLSQSAVGYCEYYTVAIPDTARYARFSILPSSTYGDFSVRGKSKLRHTIETSACTPELFGAKGDGVTDDTTAFQAALNAGSVVSGRKGASYKLSGTIALPENARICDMAIVDDGTLSLSATNKSNITFDKVAISCSDAYDANKALFNFVNTNNIKIMNCMTISTNAGTIIKFDNCHHILIDNCKFDVYYELGILGANETDDLSVENCIFESCASAVQYNYAICYYSVGSTQVTTTAHHFVIKNNYIKNPKWTAIDGHGGYDVLIYGNTIISDTETPYIGINAGDRSRAQGDNIIIANNILRGNENAYNYAISVDANNVNIENNVIDSWSRSLTSDHTYDPACVYAYGVQQLLIQNNILSNINCVAFFINGGRNVSVKNNQCKYNISNSYFTGYIFDAQADGDCIISDNLFMNFAQKFGKIRPIGTYKPHPVLKNNSIIPADVALTALYVTDSNSTAIEDYKYSDSDMSNFVYGMVNDTIKIKSENGVVHTYLCTKAWYSNESVATWVLDTTIDDTLTQAGKAADAKAAGDAIDELKSAISAIEDKTGANKSIVPTAAQTQTGYYTVNATTHAVTFTAGSAGAKDRAYTVDLSDYVGAKVSVLISNPGSNSGRATGMMNSQNVADDFYKEQNATATPWVFDITAEYPILFVSIANVENSTVTITITKTGEIEEDISAINSLIGNTPMGTTADTITGAIAEIVGSSGGDEAYLSIQPSAFPTLPYQVLKNSFGQYTIGDDILASKDITDYYHYYVDSANGSDSNNGTSAATAYKTLKMALTTALQKNAIITIAEGSVFWDGDLYGEYPVKGNLVIEGNGAVLIWGVSDPEWTETETTGVYVSRALTGQVCTACVDMGADNVDMYGLYKGMKAAASLAAIGENKYFYDSDANLMYVCPRSGGNVSDIHPLRTSYGLRWNHTTATASNFIYLDNINYIGNYFMTPRSTSYPQASYIFEYYCIGSKFSHCYLGDGIPVSNYDVVYIVDCVGGYSKADIFNHHATALSESAILASVYVLINCEAEEAGWYSASQTGNNNLFTAHEGMNILRCNCNGHNADGPMLADVNGCRSVVMDCTYFNNSYGGVTIPNQIAFNNVNAVHKGFATLINVCSGDSTHATSVKINSDCKTEIMGGNLIDKATITGELKVGV